MKEIFLTKNKGISIVDDEDYEWLSQRPWHIGSAFYATGPKGEFMHREILLKYNLLIKNKKKEVDHINRNKLDNRKENLRMVSRSINCLNRISKNKYKGIKYLKKYNYWLTRLQIHGKLLIKRVFDNEYDAALAYDLVLAANIKELLPKNIINPSKEDINRVMNLINSPQRKRRNSKSKYKGVYFSKIRKKWCADKTVNKKTCYIGGFNTEKEAFDAYVEFCEEKGLKI